jgi:putative transposase
MHESLEQSAFGLRVEACAEAIGISRATAYRALQKPAVTSDVIASPARRSPRALDEAERDQLLALMNTERFQDQPPREVYGALLSDGLYIASVSTMYRVLRSAQQSQERRAQRAPVRYNAPAVVARRPNEVWVWDITRVPGPRSGVWFYVYSVLDLFSRYVVGWLVAENESAAHSETLFRETLQRYQIVPGSLCVHSDRGAPMTSSLLQDSFIAQEVAASFSRPRVSNDNPHAEASFRTMKAQPDYPRRFHNLQDVRSWMTEYFGWCNYRHHHVSLALFTPADVFLDRVSVLHAKRQAAIDACWNAHPERFPKGKPVVPRPPAYVAIDPHGVHAHGDGWQDSSPVNPLRSLKPSSRKPQVSPQQLLKL